MERDKSLKKPNRDGLGFEQHDKQLNYINIKSAFRITCIMLILEKFINAKYGEIKNIFIYVSMQSYIKKTSGSDSSFYMPPIYDYYFLAGIS